MTFEPVLPGLRPDIVSLIADVTVDEDDARAALVTACSTAGSAAPTGELVVWAWAFDPTIERVILVDHPRFGGLLPPGGRAELDEPLDAAVLRELREETGAVPLRLDPTPVLVDRVVGTLEDGRAFETFGVAFTMVVAPDAELVGEPAQPAAWYSLRERPARASERHWARIVAGAHRLRG